MTGGEGVSHREALPGGVGDLLQSEGAEGVQAGTGASEGLVQEA